MNWFKKLFAKKKESPNMRLQRILSMVYNRPHLIEETAFHSVHTLLQSKLAGEDIKIELPDGETQPDIPVMEVDDNGIAYITIEGILCGGHLSMLDTLCGMTSTRDIYNNLRAARDNDAVTGVVLFVNSPGGSVEMVDEAAKMLIEVAAKKKVIAIVDNLAASGAQYIIAGATETYVMADAQMGSIGVYSAYLDESVAYEKAGYKVELFSAGKFKAQGFSGTSLSDDYKKIMQADVDAIYEKFKAHMVATRGLKDEVMQGLVYDAEAAVKNGLADEIITNVEDVLV